MNLQEAAVAAAANVVAIGKQIQDLQEQAKKARAEAVQPFLDALAASGEVSIIVIRGYTPSFNDGEPCEHSADYWVNVKQIVDEELHDYGDYGFELPEELVDGIEEERVWNRDKRDYDEFPEVAAANEALAKAHGYVWAPPSQDVMKAIEQLLFEMAEEENGTNYYVTYLLEDGKFVVKTGEYDCGY